MTETTTFASGSNTWLSSVGNVRDVVRQTLVTRHLLAHLPPVGDRPIRVLDVGCGQGTQMIALAHAGYTVTGVDPDAELRAAANAERDQLAPDTRERITVLDGEIGELDDLPHDFDVVLCHGVVMYLPSLDDAVVQLAQRVRTGGLLSLLSRNRAAIAMRAGMLGQWLDAVGGFDARLYDNRLGINDVRADDPDDIAAAFLRAELRRVAWYGVRLFTDHWDAIDPPSDIEQLDGLLAAEYAAGHRDPYRRLCSLTHTIGVKV